MPHLCKFSLINHLNSPSLAKPPFGHRRRHFDGLLEAVRRHPAGAGQRLGLIVVYRGVDEG